MKNLEIWQQVARPPKDALRPIKAGRLKGKSDINPQWRFRAMTELFGPCGIGWKYEINKLWNEPAAAGQVFCFAEINLYHRENRNESWSAPIPGIGGSMLVAQESAGMHSSDEGYKMAVTDALSVAMKALGVAADVYMGLWDGSKYSQPPLAMPEYITPEQVKTLTDLIKQKAVDDAAFKKFFKIEKMEALPLSEYPRAHKMLKDKPDQAPKPVAPESGATNA
jgi:hypothetical protein